MNTIPAASEAKSGENKGKIPAFSWATKTAPENAPGAKVEGGKVILEVPGDSFNVSQFESKDEILAAAGEHFDGWLLNSVNALIRAAQLRARSTAASKLELLPSNPVEWARSEKFAFDAAAFFAPTERSANAAVKAEVASALTALESGAISQDEVIARLKAMLAGAK